MAGSGSALAAGSSALLATQTALRSGLTGGLPCGTGRCPDRCPAQLSHGVLERDDTIGKLAETLVVSVHLAETAPRVYTVATINTNSSNGADDPIHV